jgi:hypothetical protein
MLRPGEGAEMSETPYLTPAVDRFPVEVIHRHLKRTD